MVQFNNYFILVSQSVTPFCLGSLISPNYFVTTAECMSPFTSNPSLVKVILAKDIRQVQLANTTL